MTRSLALAALLALITFNLCCSSPPAVADPTIEAKLYRTLAGHTGVV